MKKRISNWGNYPVIESNEQKFSYAGELEELIEKNPHFIARGNGRCYGDASLASRTISTV